VFFGQKIIPAIRSMKDFEKMLDLPCPCAILLEVHLGLIGAVVRQSRRKGKKLFLHLDLIRGLSPDEAATDYICREFDPYGIVSTRAQVIMRAKQRGKKTIQRAFIIDSNAMKKSVQLIQKTDPDMVEVLPGLIPKVISRLKELTGKGIVAGGLIESEDEVIRALQAGADAVTTSNSSLWNLISLKEF
jgi:Glycerol-3-phosphate responsive antiterminator.